MIVYSNGCSHTAGACIDRRETYPHMFMHYLTSPVRSESQQVNWEYFILPHFTTLQHENDIKNHGNDHLLVFHAHHGKSNDKIYYETIDTILRMIRVGKKPDYVMIQWSGANRKLFTPYPGSSLDDINSQVMSANPHDYSEEGIYFEPYASKHTLQLMLSLQDFLLKNEIEYVFIPYMELEKSLVQIETDSLDFSRFTTDPYEGYRDRFRFKGLSCDIHGHPNELGNYFIMSDILKILDLEEFDKGMTFYPKWSMSQMCDFWKYEGGRESIIKKLWNKLGDGTYDRVLSLLEEFKELNITQRKDYEEDDNKPMI